MRFASLRIALSRIASLRFAPLSFAPRRFAQLRFAPLRFASPAPSRSAEVGSDARILFPPLIPGLHPPLRHFEMFLVCHGPSIMPLS